MNHQTKSKRYKHLIFDLDRTLWDFETNSRATLELLHGKYKLAAHASADEFVKAYHLHNNRLWREYGAGNIKKEQLRRSRFYLALKHFKVRDRGLADMLDADYVRICPTQTALFPHTLRVLDALRAEGYNMCILTNGFVETQRVKLRASGIEGYFERVYFSETVGCAKPAPAIFEYVLDDLGAQPGDCLMIGDDWESDIMGAAGVGIDQLFFNPHGVRRPATATYEVASMLEVERLLVR